MSPKPAVARRGVGVALMHSVIAATDALGYPLVLLLGHLGYYSRFGFLPASRLGVVAPDESPSGESLPTQGVQAPRVAASGRTILVIVASQPEAAANSDALELWIAEVGEDYVVGLVAATRQGVAAGTIPAFGDKESFLEHLTRNALDKPA